MTETSGADTASVASFEWSDTDRMTRELASRVRADGYTPNVIIGVLRGGAIPAVHIAHLMNIESFGVLQLRTTSSDVAHAARVPVAKLSSPPLPPIAGLRVLLLDDVINTGATIRAARAEVLVQNPAELRTAALVWDRLSPDGVTQIESVDCDYWVETTTTWVNFPWNN